MYIRIYYYTGLLIIRNVSTNATNPGILVFYLRDDTILYFWSFFGNLFGNNFLEFGE